MQNKNEIRENIFRPISFGCSFIAIGVYYRATGLKIG